MRLSVAERLCVNKKSPIHGTGVFALSFIFKNSYLGYLSGYKVDHPTYHSVTCNGENIEPTGIFKYLNHSKSPNAKFYGRRLIALKDISKDEEVFIDYNHTEPIITESFDVRE